MKVNLNPMQTPTPTPTNTRKKTVGVSIAVCVFVSLLVGLVGFAIGTRYQNVFIGGNSGLDFSELNEVYATLNDRFDGELDRTKLMQGAASGMVAATGDPYTTFLTADDAQALTDDLSGSFDGIGIELGQNSDGQLEVISVLEGGPALEAGLRAKDVIAAINDESSLTLTPEQAVERIRGPAGSTVKLTVLRGQEAQEFSLTRAKITNPSVRSEIVDGIGYLRISRFGDDTASLADQAAIEFKEANVKGVILDLRGNGGGYVGTAQAVASLWLKPGSVVVQEKAGDRVLDTLKSSGDPTLLDVPTVVLIDGGSASASEIVAGALSDNNAAKLVGEKSYGKGSVQELLTLRSGAGLKITVAKWYTPKGSNINGDGLKPDEEIPMTAEQYNAGDDTQRARAMELLNK